MLLPSSLAVLTCGVVALSLRPPGFVLDPRFLLSHSGVALVQSAGRHPDTAGTVLVGMIGCRGMAVPAGRMSGESADSVDSFDSADSVDSATVTGMVAE